MTPVREDRTAPVRGYADEVTASPTDVQWLRGWVTENVEREGRLVGGLALVTSADFVGVGATTFTLPDFDAIVGPTGGSAVGFRLPVPRRLAVARTARTPSACSASPGTGGRASCSEAEERWRVQPPGGAESLLRRRA